MAYALSPKPLIIIAALSLIVIVALWSSGNPRFEFKDESHSPPASNVIVHAPIDNNNGNNKGNTQTEREQYLKDLGEHAIGILTTAHMHSRIYYQTHTWLTPDVDFIAEIFTETPDSSLPNVIVTNCTSSYQKTEGVFCKQTAMINRWRNEKKFENVKWFIIANDDVWFHLPNLVWLTKQYDWREPLMIGAVHCSAAGPYAVGGPGMLFSREYIMRMTTEVWEEGLQQWYKGYGRDLVKGDGVFMYYSKLAQAKLKIYLGFHDMSSVDSEYYRYMVHQIGHKWPMTLRPIAMHQRGHGYKDMVVVHTKLHQIDYSQMIDNPVQVPANWEFNCTGFTWAYWGMNDAKPPCRDVHGSISCLANIKEWPNPLPPPPKKS